MGQGIPQTTFTAGELSPSLYGRIDLAKYYTGLKTCRNFIVRQYGGVSNRTGTRFIAACKNNTQKARLIPFSFSTTQTYVLEFGHMYLRVIMNGGQVVYPASNQKAGQIVEIPTIYLADDLPRLKFTQSADVMTICHPNYPTQQLSRTDHYSWSFAAFANVNGPFQDINVDDGKTVYSSGTSGTVTITANKDLFTANMVGMMMYLEQSADAVTPKWEVSKTVTLNYIIRAGEYYYQAMTAGTTGTVKPDHTEGTECDGNPGVSWKYLHSGSGIVQITGFTSTTVVTGLVLKPIPQNLVTVTVPKTITNVVPSDGLGSEVLVAVFANGYADGSSITIAGVNGTACNGSWVIRVVDSDSFYLTNCTDTTTWAGGGTASKSQVGVPSYKWAFESWGGNKAYPAVTAYYQQRQCFGGSGDFPQAIWLSRTAGYLDFGVETVVLDDDAITFTVASREVNEVRHMIELTSLVALTSSGEWVIQGSSDGVLTPSSVNVKRQGYNGCSHVPPIVVNSTIIYIQEKGSQVRSLGYSFQQDAYIGNDLTVLSSHLFEGHTILEWAFQQIPYSCIWAVRDDGVLLGFTYMQDQEVAGWHRHDTDGLFESVCCITEGNEDALYAIVNRTINGQTKRYIERMAPHVPDGSYSQFYLEQDLIPQPTITGKRFEPKFWTINFNNEMMASLITVGTNALRVTCVFRTAGDLAGLEWQSVDNRNHPAFQYVEDRNYTGCVLSFHYKITGPGMALDQLNGPTLTLEGWDTNGAPAVYYIRLWKYAAGTPTEADITINFDTAKGGWDADQPVFGGNISRMFFSIVSNVFTGAGNTTTIVTESTVTVDITNIVVTGVRSALTIHDKNFENHGIRPTSDYDDTYNQTPEALVRQLVKTGSSDLVDWYVGASHYFSSTWNGSAFVLDPAKPKLNAAAAAWHTDFFQRLTAAGFTPVIALSLELAGTAIPAAWCQMDYTGAQSATGWTPPTRLISPCSTDGIRHLSDTFLFLLNLLPAGATKFFQLGEWWWWTNGVKPCLYDANTTAAYHAATGNTAPVIQSINNDWSAASGFVSWCQWQLGQATLNVKNSVVAVFPGAQSAVLIFPPAFKNVVGAFLINGQGLLEVLNLPWSYWKYPAFTWCQVEDYDWVTSSRYADMQYTYDMATSTLGYPLSNIHYMAGYAVDSSMWPAIQMALNFWARKGPAELFLWSQLQVIRDAIYVREDNTVHRTLDGIYCDASLSYNGLPATTFSGLDHLEGKTVTILADGVVKPQAVVSNGTVVIDEPAEVVHVGLPITAEIETLNLSVAGQNILDKKKLISKVSLLCAFAQGSAQTVEVGPDSDHLRDRKNTSNAGAEMLEILTQTQWSKNGTVVVRQTDPLPISILALIPDVAVGGT